MGQGRILQHKVRAMAAAGEGGVPGGDVCLVAPAPGQGRILFGQWLPVVLPAW